MARSRRVIDADQDEAGEGPLRLCALTRVSRSKDELIRFVRGPDGTLYPDPALKLPGRGVWVTATADKVAEAVRAKVFARSLKAEVKIPPDLPTLVGELLERRALDALSMAKKAGLVTAGFDKLDAMIVKGTVRVLLHARDAAAGGAEKLDRKYVAVSRATLRTPRIETLFTVEQMSLAIGRSNVVHAALTQGGATDKFLSEAGRIKRYRPALIDEIGIPDASGA
ncbi:MAG: RNA-binding protein [Hyphomicrobium sp.]|nr:RNA-binding protein [Hyphomicrobium sp.]